MTGVLYCADCGAKMYHKQGKSDSTHHHEYVCSSYRHYSRSCTCHYIRVEVIEKLILTAIRRVSGYARENETEFKEFSATLLNELIEKVIVHEAVKVNGKREQVVNIYLNFIGKFEIPLTGEEQLEEAPIRASKKKLRQEMTEEQVQRERDKKRYAQSVISYPPPTGTSKPKPRNGATHGLKSATNF